MRCANRTSRKIHALKHVALAVIAMACFAAAGCNSWFDQSEVTRENTDRLVVPILNSIDPIDETEADFAGAQDVRRADLEVIAVDYIIGPNDTISISVYDLAGAPGLETTKITKVSETGMVSLPMLPEAIKASGLTEIELTKKIVQQYELAMVLNKARVSVSVVQPMQRTFSILGSVNKPGQYLITETDFRILNALVQAGDTNYPSEYLYVVRKLKSEKPTTRPATEAVETTPTPPPPSTQPGKDVLAPGGGEAEVTSAHPLLASAEGAAGEPATRPAVPLPMAGGEDRLVNIGGQVRVLGASQPAAVPAVAATPTTQPASAEAAQPPFEFGAALSMDDTRVIRVPLQLLRNGNLNYNIVIRPNDVIIVPSVVNGYYFVGGHVGAPGAYNMTGQKLTLMQAIEAARMLDTLAVPSRTDVIRRVGNNAIFVRVNLWEIFAGHEPDLFLKPNDQIVVGSDWYPPFLQAVRGAFRLTYGFGFLYDRNFAPAQTGLGATATQ